MHSQPSLSPWHHSHSPRPSPSHLPASPRPSPSWLPAPPHRLKPVPRKLTVCPGSDRVFGMKPPQGVRYYRKKIERFEKRRGNLPARSRSVCLSSSWNAMQTYGGHASHQGWTTQSAEWFVLRSRCRGLWPSRIGFRCPSRPGGQDGQISLVWSRVHPVLPAVRLE